MWQQKLVVTHLSEFCENYALAVLQTSSIVLTGAGRESGVRVRDPVLAVHVDPGPRSVRAALLLQPRGGGQAQAVRPQHRALQPQGDHTVHYGPGWYVFRSPLC